MTQQIVNSATVTPTSIEAATRANTFWFVLSILAALLVVVLGVATYRANNRLQDAVASDANARIEEAKRSASDANRIGAEANERSKVLESQNLTLREKIAILEKETAAAKVELVSQQARAERLEESNLTFRGQIASLETIAAEQKERAAKAELALLTLQQKLAPRHLEREQRDALIAYLESAAKFSTERRARLVVNCLGPISEPCHFADELVSALREAGWPVEEYNRGGTKSGADSEGVLIASRNMYSLSVLRNALLQAGVEADIDPTGANDEVIILWVGYKTTD